MEQKSRRDFLKTSIPAATGMLLANRVFGQDKGSLETLQKQMGDIERFKKIAHKLLKNQYEKLEELGAKENQVSLLFGTHYKQYKSAEYRKLLKNIEQEIIEQLIRKEKPVVRDVFSSPSQPLEYTQIPEIVIETLTTKEDKLSGYILRQILENTFPKSWVYNEVGFICQNEHDKKISYGGVNARALATCDGTDRPTAKIDFYKCLDEHTTFLALEALSHELAHANDWERDNQVNVFERVNLILETYECMTDINHFKSPYVESIQEPSLTATLYYKVTEYWAVICAQYFTDPTKLSKKDFKLVDTFVKKFDPKFNVKEAKAIRNNLISWFQSQQKEISPDQATIKNKN